MTAYVEQPSDAAFRAFLRSLDAGLVQLDRASHASPIELTMLGHVRQGEAA